MARLFMSWTPGTVMGSLVCRWVCWYEQVFLLPTWVHISVPKLRVGEGCVYGSFSSTRSGEAPTPSQTFPSPHYQHTSCAMSGCQFLLTSVVWMETAAGRGAL